MKVGVSEMERRKNLCESLGGGPDAGRSNTPLHHLSHPTLQETVDTSARLPAFCLNCPLRRCSQTLGFPPAAHPIQISYFSANRFPAAHAAPTQCRRGPQPSK